MTTDEKSGLMLLGIGGGGCRLVSSVFASYGAGIRALCVDTDSQTDCAATGCSPAFQLLGGSRLAGHGAGGDAIEGRLAAQDDMNSINAHMQGIRTVLVVACLGAGTGSGATNEIVKSLHNNGLTTICFLTKPFPFEGKDRAQAAERALPLIEENADSMLVIPLDTLYANSEESMLEEAEKNADLQITEGLTLLWRILYKPGFIRLDEERLHALASRGGKTSLGFAAAEGADRAKKAVDTLAHCKLLGGGEKLKQANAILLGILAGADLRLAEIGEIMQQIGKVCKPDCRIEMGTVQDPVYTGHIELVVLAFESWTIAAPAGFQGSESKDGSTAIPPVAETFPIQPGLRKNHAKNNRKEAGSKLGFGPQGRGRFQNVEQTTFNGQDLDVPTYLRRGITLER